MSSDFLWSFDIDVENNFNTLNLQLANFLAHLFAERMTLYLLFQSNRLVWKQILPKKLHELEWSFWYVFVTKSIDLNRNQKCSTKPISVFLWPNCFDVSKQLSCVATVSQLLCRSLPLYMRCLCWYKVLWILPSKSYFAKSCIFQTSASRAFIWVPICHGVAVAHNFML